MPAGSADGFGLVDPGSTASHNLSLAEIQSILEGLSADQLDELYRRAQGQDQLLGFYNANKMNLRSYEQQLLQYEEYRVNKFLLLYVPPILIILGTFGNIFSFIILKRKAMLKFSTYFYLMVLAIADTLVLYIGLLRLWIGELTGFDLRDQADWLCKVTNVVGYTVSDFSVWLIIAVTIERYIVVCHPLKATAMCNNQRARKVILALFFALFLLNIHFFWTVQVVYYTHNTETVPQCAGADPHEHLLERVWPWVDMIVYSFLPFLVILALNALIIRQVVIARRHRHELRIGSLNEHAQRRPSHEGSTRLTIMLLTISFAFLLTTLPMNINNICVFFWNEYRTDLREMSKYRLARTVSELLMYINHSMNFFLYCATGQKFRHQLVWMICYAKRTSLLAGLTNCNSEPSGATRLESMRSGKTLSSLLVNRRSEALDINACALAKDVYTPLNKAAILFETQKL